MGNEGEWTSAEGSPSGTSRGEAEGRENVGPDVEEVIAAIEATGVEVDDGAAVAWVRAVAEAVAQPGEFVVASGLGLGGHELALLDFDEAHPAVPRLRRLAALVRTPEADDLRVALAVGGSAAQCRIQPFPADVDFFERVHIAADSREAAALRLAEVVRTGSLSDEAGSEIVLEDVIFGRARDGGPLRWNPAQIAAGAVDDRGGGRSTPESVTWSSAAAEPGFVKLSWFLSDRSLGGPTWVSKVIDATWEDRDGRVGSLDGAIDAEFQQIYLDPTAAELARRLTAELGVTERDRYVRAMEQDVIAQRRASPPNHGKAAKRLYNLCRLTDRRPEAMFLRELFDEPASRLYGARTDLRALVRERRRDPVGTVAALPALLEEVAVVVLGPGASAAPSSSAAAVLTSALDSCGALCREANSDPAVDASLRDALMAVDDALAVYLAASFEDRLLAYPPINQLLEELDARQDAG